MKAYIRLYDNGRYVCGSSSVMILDGRNSLQTMIQDGKDFLERSKKWKSFYNGFAIIKAPSFRGPFQVLYAEGINKEDAYRQEVE